MTQTSPESPNAAGPVKKVEYSTGFSGEINRLASPKLLPSECRHDVLRNLLHPRTVRSSLSEDFYAQEQA